MTHELSSPLLEGHVFETELSTNWPPYLNDHRIFGAPLFPATGYLEIGVAAAVQALGENVTIQDFTIQDPLILSDEQEMTVQTLIIPGEGTSPSFQVFSQEIGKNRNWKQHCTGILCPVPQDEAPPKTLNLAEIQALCPQEVDIPDYYRQGNELGAEYGPDFQGMIELWRSEGMALGHLALPDGTKQQAREYYLHPALLDSSFHVLGAAYSTFGTEPGSENVYVPVGLEKYQVYRPGLDQVWAFARLRSRAEGSIKEAFTADLDLFEQSGEIVAQVTGLQLYKVSRTAIWKATQKRFDEWFYRLDWQAQALEAPVMPFSAEGVWLVFSDQQGTGDRLVERLEEGGGKCIVVHVGDSTHLIQQREWVVDPASPEGFHMLFSEALSDSDLTYRGTIYLWGLDATGQPEAPSQNEEMRAIHSGLLHLVQALPHWLEKQNVRSESARLWLVTSKAQSVAYTQINPFQASLGGLANTISNEYPELHCCQLDIDSDIVSNRVQALLQEITTNTSEDRIAQRGEKRSVARLIHLDDQEEPTHKVENQPFELHVSERGILDNLTFRPVERRVPEKREVEIRVRASGLNFRDVLNVLGMYPGDPGPVGSECAGIVVALGEEVSEFFVGDEVIALAKGAFKSHAIANADLVAPKPTWMSFTEAVTIPITFLTAYYGLHSLAKIKAGDRVLIHAAAGGVGLAAVQLAQRAGAVVYGTANTKKHSYLHSIGVEHVLNSRSLDFADKIMELTHGEGVNIVLNSLADEFIPKSMGVLADHGCFLEIGKRGIWSSKQVAEFNPTFSYYVYDLSNVFEQDPGFLNETLAGLLPEFKAGRLHALPIQGFPIEETVEAFRFMAQARHIGKVVVYQNASSLDANEAEIRPDATYLITGGLGGLGLVTAGSLIEVGAKHIVLMGRSEPSENAKDLIAAWREAGTQVIIAKGDVSRESDVCEVLEQIQSTMPSLRGVVHAAGVLDDGVLSQQSWPRFKTVLAPKADGAWHLHSQTRHLPLDFFILYSSIAAVLGSSGQGNYNTANAFLDALANYRRSQGLCATSINWGPWAEVGMAAALGERDHKRWKVRGVGAIDPQAGAQIFIQLLNKNLTQVCVLPIDWKQFASQVNNVETPPILQGLLQRMGFKKKDAGLTEPNMLEQLEETIPEDRFEFLMTHVQNQVIRVLGLNASQEIDIHQGLTDLGMDSLMAVELSNRLKLSLGRKLPATVAFEYPTITALTQYLSEEVLGLSLTTKPEAGEEIPLSPAKESNTDLQEMTDDEAEASLLKELNDIGF